MANTITRRVLQDNTFRYVILVTLEGDGSGEETATRLNSVTGDMGTTNYVESIEATLTGFSAKLFFDATTDVFFAQLASDRDQIVDYRKGDRDGLLLKNNAGSGVTGDIVITTSGLGAGDSGHILLTVRK